MFQKQRNQTARILSTAVLFGCMGVVGAPAQNDTKQNDTRMTAPAETQITTSDKLFVKKAAEGGMAEVELGKLAADKGTSDDVKKFGQRMVDDHSKANAQLKQIAGGKGVAVPDDLNAKDKALKARLEKLSGATFDRAYMADMVKDHEQDVAEFNKEAKMGKDSDIKGFASETLPTLRDHLKHARSVASQTGSQAKAAARP